MPRKYARSVGKDVKREMDRYKKGTAKSGPGGRGGKVKSRKQAIAIALSEARKAGKKVPKKPAASRGSGGRKPVKKSTVKKSTNKKNSG